MKTILVILLGACLTCNAAEHGVASHYSVRSNRGTKTASGVRLNDTHLVAAHKSLKFGTEVKVTNLKNNKAVNVKIIDRGPYVRGRVIDLSQAAAKALGFHRQGVAKVKVEIVKKSDLANAPRAIVVKEPLHKKVKRIIVDKWNQLTKIIREIL